MDEEFKVRFVVDMGDTEKRVKRLKNDFVSIENNEIHFKSNIGDIDKNANSVFKNLRSMMEGVNKNPIWSNAKKQEYLKFFKGMEQVANRAFHSMEAKYSRFAQEISTWDAQKNALQVELNLKDGQAEEIRHQIDEEMSKPSRVGTYEDLVKMQAEYNKLTNMKLPYEKAAQAAKERGDMPDYESWIRDLKKIDEYQKKLMDDMEHFQIGKSIGGPDYDKIASLREKYDEIQKEAEELDKEITKMGNNPAMEKKRQELEAIRVEYGRLMSDLQGNPLDDQFRSQSLQSLNPQVENLNNGLDRSGQKIKWNTKLTEAWGKMMGRLKSRVMFSIVSMLNPIRLIRQAWSGFLEQNTKTKNTLKMIGLNLQKVIAPVLQKIANFIFKMAQYANVLTKAWFNVDLFDKSVLSAEKTEKKIKKLNQLTAGFDELNVFKEDEDDSDSGNETLDTMELPKVDTTGLEKWATEGFGKKVGDILKWSLEHPLETAGILLGAKFLGGLLGKGVGALVKKGISKLFGGSEAAEGAAAGGGLLGKIFGKTLYTGMNGKAVTVGKLLGGIALTAGGTALAISQAADAGKNWQDLTTGAKLGKTALVGLGSAAAGVGAVMLGASGPIGWAVAGGVALVSFAVGMGQVQDGIDSVKKETEKLTEANQNAEVANQNYMISVQNAASTLSALEQAEQATGLSGAALDEQVRNGTLNVENMTSAQLAVYSAYLQNEEAIKKLKEATEAKKEADHQAVLQSLKVEAANAIESKSYDTLREKVVKAWQDGSISAQEAGDILSRTLAHADDETQRTFGQSIPKEMQDAFNPDKYESGWRKFGTNFKNAMEGIGNWFKKKWDGIKNWWNSLWGKNQTPEPNAPSGPNGESWSGASYAVGTNYVPNDQLALVHKGEAIIPAKYNNDKTFGSHDAYLRSTLDAMNSEIASLRNLINQGIPVRGEFVQRGSDLYATVEKAKSKKGNQPLSNPAYAR